MFELVKSGGWLMLPIILCSILSVSIIAERFWSLRREKVLPRHLVASVWSAIKKDSLRRADIEKLAKESALGKVLSAGLLHRDESRERIKECIEERGREVVHELERYLNTLGTIASISPLLGLSVAIFSLVFYRYFRRRVDSIVVEMEREAIKMVDVLHYNRRQTEAATDEADATAAVAKVIPAKARQDGQGAADATESTAEQA